MPLNPPMFAPPKWPRLNGRVGRDAIGAVGGLALPAAQIPICWLSRPVVLRLDRPYNHAEVSQSGGVSARADNLASIATSRGVFGFSATLSTAVDADAANLAHWIVTYYGTPRMHAYSIGLDLMYRTDAERQFLLELPIGRRVQILGVPAEWPTGADQFVIGGIGHECSIGYRMLRFTTSPVTGVVAGVPGPWFRWGTSVWSSADTRPF